MRRLWLRPVTASGAIVVAVYCTITGAASATDRDNGRLISRGYQTAQSAPARQAQTISERDIERRYWEAVKTSTNVDELMEFLVDFGDGEFGELARRRVLEILSKGESPAAPPEAADLPGPASPAIEADRGQQVIGLYNEAKAAIQDGNTRLRSRDPIGAAHNYRRALDALERAQLVDSGGTYARQLDDAVALVKRNLARATAVARAAGGLGPGLVTGPNARAAFDALWLSGQVTFDDFESYPTGVYGSLRLGGTTFALRTTEFRYPLPPRYPPADTPVAMLPYGYITSPPNHRLMGVAGGGVPDGQSRYELILSVPASHFGLMRNWNTNSISRFYNEAGTLLAEHRNTTNREFVGYVADRLENRVHRIELDGLPSEPKSMSNRLYQVGEIDDLYVGTLLTGGSPGGGEGTAKVTIDNPTVDGLLLDNCVTWATNCGGAAASNEYCRSQGYTKAARWRLQNVSPTKVIGDRRTCEGAICVAVVQVVCEN